MSFPVKVKAQIYSPVYPDATIEKKYAHDTLGFKPYPDVFLMNYIHPAKKFIGLEINTLGERRYPTHKIGYQNLYRYPVNQEKYRLEDTTVLSKIDPAISFTACWCPSYDPWYISVKYKNNNVVAIGDTTALKKFLGKVDNPYNAYLWFQVRGIIRYSDIPIKTATYKNFKYKKVKHGFLITYTAEPPNGPEDASADVTYFIGEDFKTVLVATRHIILPKKGDVIYKI